jgi:uncharacterized protein (DUF2141 family)
MKIPARFLTAAAAVLAHSASASAQPSTCTGREGPVRLYVNVEGVRNSQGLIAVTLYEDDSDRFLAKRGSLYVGRTRAKAPTTSTCIYLPKTGVYALAVYHDEDGDRGIDRSAIGIPTEGVGFSNNPRLILSIPSFRSVRLSVPRNNMRTSITLRYP